MHAAKRVGYKHGIQIPNKHSRGSKVATGHTKSKYGGGGGRVAYVPPTPPRLSDATVAKGISQTAARAP